MWRSDHKEGWVPKNWCFWTVVLEKILESPLDFMEIQQVHPKGNQSWIFTGRTDAEAETPIFWPLDLKNWLTGKDPDAGKDWRQEEKGMTVDEMVGWHHWLNGHEFEQALGVTEKQRSLACFSPWGYRVRHNWGPELTDSDGCIFHFLLCLLLLFFTQLFVRPLQTTILPFCISFYWGWFWSPPPVQCYIVLQALYQI